MSRGGARRTDGPAVAPTRSPMRGCAPMRRLGRTMWWASEIWVDGCLPGRQYRSDLSPLLTYHRHLRHRWAALPRVRHHTREQLAEIVGAYFPRGWQIAPSLVHGDGGVDTFPGTFTKRHQSVILETIAGCGRTRRGHPPDQLRRAAELRCHSAVSSSTRSTLGDIVDDLPGVGQRGSRWMPAGSAVAAGMRIQAAQRPARRHRRSHCATSAWLHPGVAPSGRVLAPEERRLTSRRFARRPSMPPGTVR